MQKITKLKKIGLYFISLISFIILVNAFDINISPSLEPEYRSSAIPLSVVISDTYHSWKYSLNNNPNITVCSYNTSEKFVVSFNNGSVGGSWNLYGDNDIKIEFDSSLLPQKPIQGVEVCFLLYDNDGAQENNFQFKVNNGSVYSIKDNESMPAYIWSWKCANLNPSDFFNEYIITAWYENRSAAGGVALANNAATPGSSSYSDTSSNNLPDDYNLSWVKYVDDTDWMVDLTIITQPQQCPLVFSTTIQAELGQNTITVWANRSTSESANYTQTFWVVNITNISIVPKQLLYGNQVTIKAEVVADSILSVFAAVTKPNAQVNIFEMFDDGNHNDGLSGDKIYGALYNATLPGQYKVDITATTPFTTMNRSDDFYAKSSTFDITSPKNGQTIESSKVNLSVILPTNVSRWGISVDNGPNTTICSYSPAVQNVSVNFTDGVEAGPWNLNGNNDARITFKESDLPPGKHQEVTFCFYLFDNNGTQEESFQFQVNNGGIYSIPDDENIILGAYNWVCKSISPSDFSTSYAVSFWYSDRSPSGGVYIAHDNSIPGSSSLYDTSPQNLPNASNEYMNFVTFFDNSDWMITAIITVDEYFCPETHTRAIDIQPGLHSITAFMENSSGLSSKSVSFERIGIQNIAFYPKSVKPENTINIQASVFSSSIKDVKSVISPQTGLPTTIPMFDDGLHNDSAASDHIFGTNYTPTFANPYNVTVILTTADNVTASKSDYFVASNTRVAIVYSNTTVMASIVAKNPMEIEYIEWITSLQHLFMMAGVPFEVISEESLKDLNVIRQYDSIAMPSFRNVPISSRAKIIQNLETAVKNYGIGMLAFGEFMTHDENNTLYSNYEEPLNRIFNAQATSRFGSNVSTLVRVNDISHPSAWRFKQGEELISFNNDFYVEYVVRNATEKHAYPYTVFDVNNSRNITNVVASQNHAGRAFYTENQAYVVQTAIGRDAILWLLYGDKPHIGVKSTDKTVLFTTRVDADLSYDTAQTSLAMQNYRELMARNNFVAGWYITTNNQGVGQVQWEQLKDDYWNLLNAGHEIGSHSVAHPANINLLPDDQVFYEMSQSKIEIERELGIDISGFVNPGDSPLQSRLWRISERAGYEYYSPLDDDMTKGIGYIDDKIKLVSLQSNLISDYELLTDLNKTIPEAMQAWKDQYDKYYRLGDGIILFGLWHDYNLDENPGMYSDFADYVAATDSKGITPSQAVEMFREWRKQDLLVNISEGANGMQILITRTTPDAKFAQITLPPGSTISQITGASAVKNTTDGKSIVFAFEDDTVEVLVNAVLWLQKIEDKIVNENETLTINLSAIYLGDGNLTYGTNASFGTLNSTTGKFIWTPTFDDVGNYSVAFNVSDGKVSNTKTAKIIVLPTRITEIIPLNEGWNLISIPLLQKNNSVEEVFREINLSGIFSYDSIWRVPTEINYTLGYWINSLQNQNLTVKGYKMENTSLELNAGWNLVGYPSLITKPVTEVFDISGINSVSIYNNSRWYSYAPNKPDSLNTLKQIEPGYGYWVNAK